MALKFIIQSVPHSGTRFTKGLFDSIGNIEYDIKHFSSRLPENSIILTPLRDPYLVAMSVVYKYSSKERSDSPLDGILECYGRFIYQSNKKKFVYLDIDCPKEKRQSHLISVLKQLDVYKDNQLPTIKTYANQWEAVGASDYEWKRLYEETGEIPKEIDTPRLQRAVNWYNKIKLECIYDYIT